MPQFSRREGMATAAAGAAALATLALITIGVSASRAHRQRDATAAAADPGLRPVATDGTPAREVAAGDGALDLPASGSPAAPGQGASGRSEIVVYVTGAVKRPGVYALKPGDRIYHAIRAAGGFKEDADRDALNLADAVQDADQINVPVQGSAAAGSAGRTGDYSRPATRVASAAERIVVRPLIIPGSVVHSAGAATTVPPRRPRGRVLGGAGGATGGGLPSATDLFGGRPPGAGDVPVAGGSGDSGGTAPAPPDVPASAAPDTPDAPAAPAADEPPASAPHRAAGSHHRVAKLRNPGDGVINVNTAALEDLERLPGIGKSTAQKILDYRSQNGPFNTLEDLRHVKGIGDKRLSKIQPFVVFR